MNISRIGLAVHQLDRARQIISILMKYGFGEFVYKSGFGKHLVTRKRLVKIQSVSEYERLRKAIEELGPTFIKFGQILADRPDLLKKEVRDELKKLQDDAHPLDDAVAVAEIEKQLKQPIDKVFQSFERKHIASASIAQAYKGVLITGEKVAVKVQRPGIDKTINLDLQLMDFFAAHIQKNNEDFQAMDVVGIVEEFGKSIRKELDFNNEAANMLRFAHNFTDNPFTEVPKVYMQYTNKRIIVEEFVEGIELHKIEKVKEAGNDPAELAHRGVKLLFEQIFNFGFFHADPHPGNIFIKSPNKIVFIDYGMMGSLRPYHMDFLGKYGLGYLQKDPKLMTEALLLLCQKKHFEHIDELEFEISDMMKHYQYLSYKEINFGEVMNKSIDIVVKYNLRIPPTIYLLIKALITIQGVATLLNPKLDIAREMEPFARNLLLRQFNPKKMAKNVVSSFKSYYELISELPGDISEILYKTKEGKMGMKLELSNVDHILHRLEKVSKHISRSIILASLIIGTAIVSTLENVKWVGHAIFLFAIILGFWSFFRNLRD